MTIDVAELEEFHREFSYGVLCSPEPLLMSITAWKDGRQVMTIWPPMPNHELILWGMTVMAAAAEPDAITMLHDSYASMQKGHDDKPDPDFKPVKRDGTLWSPGEMTRAWEEDWPEKEELTEAVTTTICDREGNVRMITMMYERVGTEIEWTDTLRTDDRAEGEGHGGRFPDIMRRAMATAPLMKLVEDFIDRTVEDVGIDRRTAWRHGMIAAVKVLQEEDFAVGLGSHDEEDLEYITERLKEQGLLGEEIRLPQEGEGE